MPAKFVLVASTLVVLSACQLVRELADHTVVSEKDAGSVEVDGISFKLVRVVQQSNSNVSVFYTTKVGSRVVVCEERQDCERAIRNALFDSAD